MQAVSLTAIGDQPFRLDADDEHGPAVEWSELMAERTGIIARGVARAVRQNKFQVADSERDAIAQEVALRLWARWQGPVPRSKVSPEYVAQVARGIVTNGRTEWSDTDDGWRRVTVNGKRTRVKVETVRLDQEPHPSEWQDGIMDGRVSLTDHLLGEDARSEDVVPLRADLGAVVEPLADALRERLALTTGEHRRVVVALTVAAHVGRDDDDDDKREDKAPTVAEAVARVAERDGMTLETVGTYHRAGARILRERIPAGELLDALSAMAGWARLERTEARGEDPCVLLLDASTRRKREAVDACLRSYRPTTNGAGSFPVCEHFSAFTPLVGPVWSAPASPEPEPEPMRLRRDDGTVAPVAPMYETEAWSKGIRL